mgnify:CR=1 FL=1
MLFRSLKHSLIFDKKFFLWLSKNGKKIINRKNNVFLKKAIVKSCKIKCKIVTKDEKEKDLRMILNFGHTFAHGFESAKNFSKKLKNCVIHFYYIDTLPYIFNIWSIRNMQK